MKYTEAVSYIESKNSLGIVPGLDVILALMEGLGHPEQEIPAIHIAGTNGKGTVMAYIEQVLLAAGYRVGRYLSPAVVDPREKWQINGHMPSEEEVAEAVEKVRAVAEALPNSPTSFELETAVAFVLFRDHHCDVMLIECGMGGRLDATNVIPRKVLDILVSVSMDHMQFLGNSREKILQEKLGIVKPGDPLVTAPLDEELRSLMKTYRVQDSQKPGGYGELLSWREADRDSLVLTEETLSGTRFRYREKPYHICMVGDVAVDNAITALTALEIFNERAEDFGLWRVTEEEITAGLEKTSWQGRFTVFDTKPKMIVDGAHNRDAWGRLAGTLERFFGLKKRIYVMGVLADKEVDVLLDTLLPTAKKVYVFTPDSPRALSGKALAERIREAGGDAEVLPSPTEAARKALREADETDVIVACGSLTFMGELLKQRSRLEMDRVERILQDTFYKKQIKKIYESEYDRIFCRHGFGHAVSVARIAYILAMEEGLRLRKDVIYGAALLHDAGRYTPEEKEMSHHAAGALYARGVLEKAGYTKEETDLMCNAIREHKDPGDRRDTLDSVLYRADKLSRNCFLCDAREECYWSEERKNHTIVC